MPPKNPSENEKRASINARFLTKTPFFYLEYNSPYFFPIFFKKFIPAFFDPLSIILFDRFYLKTDTANTIKLSVSFY